ncbi:hypothetical protein [Streptomyces atratus]|uniref:hypothetical protein n=1 Tax=Streptomyces atratus TaxID=1893 RepID=UPI0033E18C44
MADMVGETRGLGGPNSMVSLLLVGLVLQAFFVWGYPRGLICVGGLLFVIVAISRDIQHVRARAALLAESVAVPGRVVAVTKDVTDGDGGAALSFIGSASPPGHHSPCSVRAAPSVVNLFRFFS